MSQKSSWKQNVLCLEVPGERSVLGRGAPEQRWRSEIPHLPDPSVLSLGMKTSEGPAKEFALDSGMVIGNPDEEPS